MKYHSLPNSVIPWVLLVIALTAFDSSRAALLLYEPFSTTTFSAADTKLGRVTGQWNLGNNTDANDGWSMVRSAAALSYSSLVTSNGSRGVARIPNTYSANRNIGAPWATAVTSGSVYCSFLINVTTPPQANRALLVLSLFSSGNIAARNDGCGAVAWLNPNRQLQVGKYSTSVLAPATTPALEPGVTHLVVLRYTFNPGAGDDVVALFLNPVTTGAEPGGPTISTTAGADSSQMKSVWLPQSQSPEFGSHTGEIRMDEIRVGDTWADVLPSDGTPPPAVRVPRITEVLLSGSDLVLSGTNGPPSGGYQVLRSPDLTPPVEGWPGIGIESFDSNGDFSFTNRLPADTANFYRLQVISTVPVSAPVITTQPQDLAIEVGGNATFNVTATGSEPLTYRWYFNTNTLMATGSSASLTITNAQLTNSGEISVTVSNLVGNAQSVFAMLTVTNNTQPPGIVAQPGNLMLFVGQNATFGVTATGATPLQYQWYHNTNIVLTGKTNSSLTLLNVNTNQAGKYSVTVTNLFGSTNSMFGTLTVSTNATAVAIPDGYATQNGGTTGGGSATPIIVSTAAAFQSAVNNNNPAVIIVNGTLNVGTISIGSNKTIMGADTNSGLSGGTIRVGGSNYIFQNLTIGPATGDTMEISGAKNVFITKCEFFGSTDELCSIVRAADFVTVSWSKFHFPTSDSHSFAHLIGNGDTVITDRDKLHVTLHHNWYAPGVEGRMPRVRFGHVHIYNNYFNAVGNGYCIGIGVECNIRVENSHFESINNAWADYGGTISGELGWANLKFVNCSQPTFMPNTFPVFTPPYPYTLDPVDNVKALVMHGAGNVKTP